MVLMQVNHDQCKSSHEHPVQTIARKTSPVTRPWKKLKQTAKRTLGKQQECEQKEQDESEAEADAWRVHIRRFGQSS